MRADTVLKDERDREEEKQCGVKWASELREDQRPLPGQEAKAETCHRAAKERERERERLWERQRQRDTDRERKREEAGER